MGTLTLVKPNLKVAKILNNYSLVINGGGNNGISEGDELEIFDPGVEVKDPDSNSILGRLEYVKAKIVVVKVYDSMAVCKNAETTNGALADSIAAWEPRQKALDVSAEAITGGYDTKIYVGDRVRSNDPNSPYHPNNRRLVK